MQLYLFSPVPGSSSFKVEIAIANMNKDQSPSSDQSSAELIRAGGETLLPESQV
jgi:hypothetical protein